MNEKEFRKWLNTPTKLRLKSMKEIEELENQ